jgi:hypothetical protein
MASQLSAPQYPPSRTALTPQRMPLGRNLELWNKRQLHVEPVLNRCLMQSLQVKHSKIERTGDVSAFSDGFVSNFICIDSD